MSDELIDVAEGQLCGESLFWGKPTGEIKPIPPGKYFRRGAVLMAADGEEGETLTPSSKVSFKLPDTEGPKSVKKEQPPIQYDVLVEYQPSNTRRWRTIVTVVDKAARTKGAATAYRQCVLSGEYSQDQARRVWEREPSRFGPVSSKSVGETPTERKADARKAPAKVGK